MEDNVVVANVLYRHFKGDYYLVEKVATNEADGKAVVIYTSATSGKTFVRPYSEFFTDVTDRKDNITHQVHRFEPATEIQGILRLTSTQDIVEELERRPDNPYEGCKTLDEDENVWSVQYILGRVQTKTDPSTGENYDEFVPLTPLAFDDLEKAKQYRDRCFANRQCIVARRVTKKLIEY